MMTPRSLHSSMVASAASSLRDHLHAAIHACARLIKQSRAPLGRRAKRSNVFRLNLQEDSNLTSQVETALRSNAQELRLIHVDVWVLLRRPDKNYVPLEHWSIGTHSSTASARAAEFLRQRMPFLLRRLASRLAASNLTSVLRDIPTVEVRVMPLSNRGSPYSFEGETEARSLLLRDDVDRRGRAYSTSLGNDEDRKRVVPSLPQECRTALLFVHVVALTRPALLALVPEKVLPIESQWFRHSESTTPETPSTATPSRRRPRAVSLQNLPTADSSSLAELLHSPRMDTAETHDDGETSEDVANWSDYSDLDEADADVDVDESSLPPVIPVDQRFASLSLQSHQQRQQQIDESATPLLFHTGKSLQVSPQLGAELSLSRRQSPRQTPPWSGAMQFSPVSNTPSGLTSHASSVTQSPALAALRPQMPPLPDLALASARTAPSSTTSLMSSPVRRTTLFQQLQQQQQQHQQQQQQQQQQQVGTSVTVGRVPSGGLGSATRVTTQRIGPCDHSSDDDDDDDDEIFDTDSVTVGRLLAMVERMETRLRRRCRKKSKVDAVLQRFDRTLQESVQAPLCVPPENTGLRQASNPYKP